MKCLECGSDISKWFDGRQKVAELARVRAAIDRACRVVMALALDEWASEEEGDGDRDCRIERRLARRELCILRARERELAAEVEGRVATKEPSL